MGIVPFQQLNYLKKENTHPRGGSLGRLVGPLLGKGLIGVHLYLKGGQGVLPLGYLPLFRERGGTFQTADARKRIMGKHDFSRVET